MSSSARPNKSGWITVALVAVFAAVLGVAGYIVGSLSSSDPTTSQEPELIDAFVRQPHDDGVELPLAAELVNLIGAVVLDVEYRKTLKEGFLVFAPGLPPLAVESISIPDKISGWPADFLGSSIGGSAVLLSSKLAGGKCVEGEYYLVASLRVAMPGELSTIAPLDTSDHVAVQIEGQVSFTEPSRTRLLGKASFKAKRRGRK